MSESKTAVTEVGEEPQVETALEGDQTSKRRYLRPKEFVAFCVAYFGQKNLEEFLNNNVQYFLLQFFKLPSTVYANLVLATGIYDAVDDTISGLIIDRTRTRWGRVKPYLILPLPLIIISTLMLFSTPDFGNTGKTIWACASMLLRGLAFSYFGAWYLILYNNTPNTSERNNLITISEFAKLFSTWIVSIIPIFLDLGRKTGISETSIFSTFAIVCVVITVLTSIFGFANMRERIPLQSREEMNKVGVVESFRQLFKNRPMFVMVLANCFNSIKSVGSSNEKIFWLNCTGKYSYATISGIFTGLPNYFMTPLTGKWVNKFGARKTIIAGGLFGFAAYFVMFLIGYAPFGGGDFGKNTAMNLVWMIIALTVCGLPNSIIRVCLPSLMSDVYDYTEWKTGLRNEGLVNTISGYFEKVGYNINNWLGGMVLTWVHYVPVVDANGNAVASTDPSVLRGLWAVFALAPAAARLLLGLSCILFNVHGKFKEDMLIDLEERRRIRVQALTEEQNQNANAE
ncbi:MAG: MFS transporter [Ruminococcus sp.]|nr:MFS transporter [Ruminococcus sp.]